MSQIEILLILQELGGTATHTQIVKRAKEKFPDLTLYQYVGNRIQKLIKSGTVKVNGLSNGKYSGDRVYTIIDDSVLQNRNIIQ